MDVLDFDSSSDEDRHEAGALGEADENICGAGAREVGGSVL